MALLKSLFAAALTPWEMDKTVLYRHIAAQGKRGNPGTLMLPGLLSELENDSKYAFLRSNLEFQQLIGKYRAEC